MKPDVDLCDKMPRLTKTCLARVAGSRQSGNILKVRIDSGITIDTGDLFSIEGVRRFHPHTGKPCVAAGQFVATETLQGTGAPFQNLHVHPAILFSDGAFDTVDALPIDGAELWFYRVAPIDQPSVTKCVQ